MLLYSANASITVAVTHLSFYQISCYYSQGYSTFLSHVVAVLVVAIDVVVVISLSALSLPDSSEVVGRIGSKWSNEVSCGPSSRCTLFPSRSPRAVFAKVRTTPGPRVLATQFPHRRKRETECTARLQRRSSVIKLRAVSSPQ